MEGLLIIAILLMIAGCEKAALCCVAPVFLFIALAILHSIGSCIFKRRKPKA